MNFFKTLLAALTLSLGVAALAQDAVIRKNLAERIPQFKTIDEVSKSPLPGLFEVRINGTDIFYTDAEGNFLIQGSMIDTRQRRNLTEERVAKLSAVSLDALPTKDAITMVRGSGKRKLAIFEDPNCGYCKRLERDLEKIDNVTIHMFLYPILGADSVEKSKNIWCAKDRAKAWTDWMMREKVPAATVTPACDVAAITRNVELGRKHKINGTPTLFFADGSRVPGAISASDLEKYLGNAN